MKVIIKPAQIGISIADPDITVSVGPPVARERVEVDPYGGPYEVTPTSESQTLETNGKRMTGDVVINPIPSNYGLITWNGAFLTVS